MSLTGQSQDMAKFQSLIDNMKNDDVTVPTAITTARNQIEENINSVKALGEWPDYIDARASLLGRIPAMDGTTFGPGFDAGIAVALNLIPWDKQALSAKLHANYSAESVAQVRSEIKAIEDGHEDAMFSETAHWLLANSVCNEGGVTAKGFVEQVRRFREIQKVCLLSKDDCTNEEWNNMIKDRQALILNTVEKKASVYKVLSDGVVMTSIDGGLQGAYINGYEWGVLWAQPYNLFFIGTYRESLGLEDFEWSSAVTDKGETLSGPVHGSQQFVKCASIDELNRAVAVVKETFLS